MEVKLIAKTCPVSGASDMDVVEQAACVCYNSEPTPEHRIVKACYRDGHWSTLEHISFTFHVKGVSRALLAQLSRHRHISLSVASQRYISYEDGFDYVNPFTKYTDSYNSFESDIKVLQDYYKKYIHSGEKAENARAILPNACCTELYLTMNARALIESSGKRLCTRAQAEIRELFQKMTILFLKKYKLHQKLTKQIIIKMMMILMMKPFSLFLQIILFLIPMKLIH